MRPFADSSSRVRLPQHFCPSQRATDTRHGFIASGMTTVHVKFPSEATHATVTVPTPATPAGVCAAVLAARPDLGKMLDAKGQYAGFELSLVDPKTGRPMNPDDADAVPHDAKMELVLSKGYAVRAFAPVRKYVVGRFSGERPPKFKSGRATAVEWQLCRQRSDVTGREPNLQLVSESKKGGRVQFNGARESASLGNFFLLMMQASTTDVCAIPMEQWYNFRPVANRRVMTLEEAEERLEARGRHTTSTSQWLEKVSKGGLDDDDDGLSDSDDVDRFKTQAGDSSDDDDDDGGKKKKKKNKSKAPMIKQEPEEEDVKAGNDVGDAPGARGIVKAEGDDWEHDAGASDDEVAGEGMGDEIEMVDADDAKPPPKTGGGPNDDGDDDDDEDLDAEGAKLKRLLGREEEAATAAELGGFSDEDDSDSEFVDPDQEELHPFLLQQRNKAEQAQIQKAQAAAQAAQAAAAQAAAQAAAAVKPEPVSAGVKRARDGDDDASAAPAKAIKTEPGAGAAMRPIEAALRAILRGASKVTTKDVTKQLRKKGLLGTDEDKEELKSTIGRVAKINKEGAASYVVLK